MGCDTVVSCTKAKSIIQTDPARSDPDYYSTFPIKVHDDSPDIGNFTLPGNGKPGVNCGTVFTKGCRTCGKRWESVSRCEQRECPECGRTYYARRRGSAIRGRVLDGVDLYGSRAHSIILSPPPDHPLVVALRDTRFDRKANYRSLRTLAKDVSRMANIDGECLVFHPYRSKHADGSSCESPFCREPHYWVWGAHFHAFAVSEFVSPGDYVYHKSDGWLLKRSNSFDPHVLEYYSYAIHHAGILIDDYGDKHPLTHVATWNGSLSYRKMPLGHQERTAKLTTECCPWCGSDDVHGIAGERVIDRSTSYRHTADKPPPVCPDCGCSVCSLIREAEPCNHVHIPDDETRVVERRGGCKGTVKPLIGESMMVIRCR
jgi:hypothetical protein